jgi:hypothetical protein
MRTKTKNKIKLYDGISEAMIRWPINAKKVLEKEKRKNEHRARCKASKKKVS